MKRMHFGTVSGNTVTLLEPGYDNKQSAIKGARDLEPGSYFLMIFDSPEPVVVAPPVVATRNVAKFGKPFVEREKRAKPAGTAKPKPKK